MYRLPSACPSDPLAAEDRWRTRPGSASQKNPVATIALIPYQRYAHAKPFKQAAKALRRLRTMLGRVIRDITRKTAPRPELAEVFALPLALARRVRDQRLDRGSTACTPPRWSASSGQARGPKARPISAMSSA